MPAGLEPFSPSAGDPWDMAKAAHLLRRGGFGALPPEIARATQAGPAGAVDALFNFPPAPEGLPLFGEIDLAEARMNEMLREMQRTRTKPKGSPEFRAAYEEANRAHSRSMVALTSWWLARMAKTPAPLQEKLTLFWHGHFTTSFGDVHDAIALSNQNQLFRQHAAGNFARLLDGVARDPAMLRYLNNDGEPQGPPQRELGP